ncbi:MAG: hypothetical protein QXU18_11820 [Thermoplasmatales archaeon]
MLFEVYSSANEEYANINYLPVTDEIKESINIIVKKSEDNRGLLTVTITSLLKKIADPAQDVRFHQSGMPGGYSGRTLDTEVVTPFLKGEDLPHMSESGWLTRSLEHPVPYDFNYTGSIKPDNLKKAFLSILNGVQERQWDAYSILKCIFIGLIKQREMHNSLQLSKPRDKTIDWIVDALMNHFNAAYNAPGASRLPVLAIYAAYQQFMSEVKRYRGKKLAQLKSHNSPDTMAGDVGDIQVLNEDGSVFEGVEVKHNIKITADLVETSYNKFRSQQVDRYYLLTTKIDDPIDFSEVTRKVIEIKNNHGCQVIVNGVESSMKYYLRLLSNTNEFISNYVNLVSADNSIKYEHRKKWNVIASR